MEKALFWDFDGTLIYPNESFLDALQMAFTNYKYEISIEQIKQNLHTVCSWYTPDITYTQKAGQKWWKNFFEHFDLFYDIHKIAKEDREKINIFFKGQILDFNNYTLYDDAKIVLSKCIKMGYRNYIISNNFPELPLIIRDFKLSTFFTDYIISSNIGYEKPRAEIFQHALRIAHFPDYCYMIGDNPIADIQGGKSVGMNTILVHKSRNSVADYVCNNLCEIPALLV